MNYRQLGYFKISEEMVKNNPEEVAEIFALLKMVPIRCEFMFDSCCFEYIGICESFPDCPEGSKAPEFELKVSKDSCGRVELVDVVPSPSS